MRILFDQATPVPIRMYLEGTPCAQQPGEAGSQLKKNGDLLNTAEGAGFDLLLTTDKNMRYQQNFVGRKIAIVVTGQQQWPRLRPHAQLVVEAVNAAVPRSYTEVGVPGRSPSARPNP